MPALAYTSTNFPFRQFTTAYSADVNSCFNDIKTLLNTTGLDDTNLANAGITRSTKLKTGTAGAVVVNDGTGKMSELVLGSPNQVLQVNPGGTASIFGAVPPPATETIYMSQNFV